MRVYEIIYDRLFTSGHTKNKRVQDKLDTLAQLGITHVVNLTGSVDPDLVSCSRVTYLHRPVPDGRINTNHLAVANEVLALIKGGRRVLVHCIAGRNRAPFIAALVYKDWYHVLGWTAYLHLRAVRKNSLVNEFFFTWLKENRET